MKLHYQRITLPRNNYVPESTNEPRSNTSRYKTATELTCHGTRLTRNITVVELDQQGISQSSN